MAYDKIFETARQLGELIGESKEKIRADKAAFVLNDDKAALELMDGFSKLRDEELEKFEGKEPSADEARKLNEFLQSEFEKLAANDIIKEYLDASREYQMMVSQVDGILQHFISGQDDSGCSGSCSICGGCH